MKVVLPLTLALLTTAAAVHAAEPIAGIGPIGEVRKVHGNLMFTEGPAADRKGNLYFTDVAGNKIYKVDAEGKLTPFLDPSNHCNGLMFDEAGKLYACEMDGRILQIDVETKAVTVLADTFDGKRFNAPNDLVIDQAGGVYFTDPRFRAPMPLPQGKEGIYYRDAEKKITRLIDDLPAPNGVILSPDEKTLYAVPTLTHQMWAYPIEAPGKIGAGKVFCELKQPEGKTGTGGDGLTIDTKGNLYITSQLGAQVFDPTGKLLGVIAFPEQPSNLTFGGKDGKTLYATARTSLYAVEMEIPGHQFPGKK